VTEEQPMDPEKIEITIQLERTDNPRVVKVNGVTVVGRAEARRELLAQARAEVDELLAGLFPAKE